MRDAHGRAFVMVVQVAPIDVVSVHASNMGSEGPGIEIALNTGDTMDPLQGVGAMLAATMAKAAVPRLTVVNHRGEEGRAALRAYETHRRAAGGTRLTVPFTPAAAPQVASATGRLDALLAPLNGSAPIAVARRSFVPPKGEPTDPGIDIPPLAMAAVPVPRVSFLGNRPEPSAGGVSAVEPKLIAPPRLVGRPSKPWRWLWAPAASDVRQ
jgi:hypothetical protein